MYELSSFLDLKLNGVFEANLRLVLKSLRLLSAFLLCRPFVNYFKQFQKPDPLEASANKT
jgi:hypothetical protein